MAMGPARELEYPFLVVSCSTTISDICPNPVCERLFLRAIEVKKMLSSLMQKVKVPA
jgi:hypothetical protein